MSPHPLLQFGLPPDTVSLVACGGGLLLLALSFSPRAASRGSARRHARLLLTLLALCAAALSIAYFHGYLGGAPRIIDATAYLLEGRIFARGEWSFLAPEPSALFRGRFLIHTAEDPARLGVIFPPGYPLLLALGERLGSYTIVGPLLALGLVAVTARLAFQVTRRREVALLAAALSCVNACLRYQTADTMSHGWSALLVTWLISLTLTIHSQLRARSIGAVPVTPLLLWGLSAGLALATRELTGLVFSFVCGIFLLRSTCLAKTPLSEWFRLASFGILGLLPPLLLLLSYHQSITGELFGSPQMRYYAFADGPPGCFGLGLGKGCHFEHGDVVRAQGGGLDLYWALRNTWRRLHAHSLDLAHFEPLFLVALWWLYRKRRALIGQLGLGLILALPLAYAFFYFDGNYPGGGARFLSELLPLEHVALAAALTSLGRVRLGLALSLLGFALHASYSHAHLRDHMRGAPSSALFAQLPVAERHLVFVDSDHAFLALFDPGLTPASPGLHVARRSRDSRETWLWERLGRPPAYHLTLNSELHPWTPPAASPLQLEAEADWPPLDTHRLWTHPAYPPGSCVSGGRSLLLHPVQTPSDPPPTAELPSITLEARGIPPGRYLVRAWFWSPDQECTSESLGERWLPGAIELPLSDFEAPRHLDRIELSPLEEATQPPR